jgi:HAD superfamily hydrolase (TIGR01450 family)
MKKLFLMDMDGTLYLGEQLFEGTAEFLTWVRASGGQYAFLTNNSSRGIEGYLAKMERLGIPQKAFSFLTSTDATIDYLKKTYAPFAPGRENDPPAAYYVCGTENLKSQLRTAGLKVLTEAELAALFEQLKNSCVSLPVVLLGYDTELTYEKLVNCVRLLDMGADYVATHPDLVCPTEYGNEPDIGLVINSLKVCTGREPVVIGKPQPQMVYSALKKYGATPEETVLIGDRLYTDIACGNNAGIDTILVLSGEGTAEDCAKYGVTPTWIYKDIAAVLEDLKTGVL